MAMFWVSMWNLWGDNFLNTNTVLLPVKLSFQPRVTRTHATPSEGWQSNHALVHSSHLKGCTQKTTLHPGRLTWNLKMMVWKMVFRISIGCFLGSMLIFRGVVPTNKLQELVKLRKTKQEKRIHTPYSELAPTNSPVKASGNGFQDPSRLLFGGLYGLIFSHGSQRPEQKHPRKLLENTENHHLTSLHF